MNIALIVEGVGDASALPVLVAKAGNIVGSQLFAPHPIKAGGLHNISKTGVLERFAELAATRNVDRIVVAVDLDDGCPVQVANDLQMRCSALQQAHGKAIQLCFIKREYETWFLQLVDQLSRDAQEYGWKGGAACNNPESIRGAKQELSRMIAKSYKETSDQGPLTKRIDVRLLYARDRSFRRFVKCITGMNYNDLDKLFALPDAA
jgi:hypothetical protein